MPSLYDIALKAINDLFSDMSSSKGETIENLNGLQDEISTMIEALETDIANEEAE